MGGLSISGGFTMLKRFLSLALVLCCLAGCLVLPAGAEGTEEPPVLPTSGTCGEDLTWTLSEDGTLTISGTGDMEDFGDMKSPWYDQREKILKVKVEDGATSIGNYSFQKCEKMAEIIIPESVTRIGLHAFAYCSGLTTLNFPANLVEIDDCALEFCSGLTTLRIPDSVKRIGAAAFSRCTNLKSINIPNSIKRILPNMFTCCESLESISIPETIVQIDGVAFSDCNSFKELAIPKSVTTITTPILLRSARLERIIVDGDNPSYCSDNGILFNKDKTKLLEAPIKLAISRYSVPESVQIISENAFSWCQDLESITIPNVTEIGQNAFELCTGLTSIYDRG